MNKIICGNAVEVLGKLPPIDLVVTSPPYDDLRAYKGYKFEYRAMLGAIYEALADGGMLIWNVADQTKNGGRTLTSFRHALTAQEIGFTAHDVMIWHKQNVAFQHKGRFTNEHEYIFAFCKGRKPKTFNEIRVPCKWAGKTGGNYMRSNEDGPYRTGNVIGVKEDKQHGNVFAFQTGGINYDHPAPFPPALPDMFIKAFTNKGDLVVDPMSGSGTTCLAADRLGRNWIGIDMAEEYCETARQRIKDEAPLL